ncbi:hypothetical protein RRG08_015144 [Elysia crispata]|uniref:Uncharacterized protein n=1 Tax=Elysia crispata TaxID=231223 RepID=A0AAE1DF93_9GAST|nr:hypothetical protein RRG08_015144 [Elysia crispata]
MSRDFLGKLVLDKRQGVKFPLKGLLEISNNGNWSQVSSQRHIRLTLADALHSSDVSRLPRKVGVGQKTGS